MGGLRRRFIYTLLPAEFQDRTATLVLALEGQPVDTSAAKRIDFAANAIQLIKDRPLGVGWAGSGWPHNDFLQLAANLGIVAGMVFAVVILARLWQTWQKLYQLPRSAHVIAIGDTVFLMLLVGTGLLASQGVQVLPQLALPVWFAIAGAEAWLDHNFEIEDALTKL